MKRNILMLTMMVLGLISFNQAKAQTMVAGGVDSVAVGSQVIYEVTPDANIGIMVTSGALDPSQFDWTFDGASVATGTINTVTNGGTVDLYPASINVTWDTEGAATVKVAENSVKDDAIVCADATPREQSVLVFPLPTFTTDGGNDGACGSADYNVPLTLTGYGPWTVDYEIAFTDLGGTTSTTTDSKIIGDVSNEVGTTPTDFDLPILAADLGATGTYDITITNVDDRLTLKDQNTVTTVSATAGASTTYTLYVFPTPETGAIKHISNE